MSAPRYPYVVQDSVQARALQALVCLVVMLAAVWMTVVILQLDDNEFWATSFLLLLFAVTGFGGAWFAGIALTQRTILDANGVTVESVWRSRRFERVWLDGWRWSAKAGHLVGVELYRKSDPRPFLVWVPAGADPTIEAWFGEARDLQVAQIKESIAEIEGDESLGATREDRLETADAETLMVRRAYWLFFALLLWVMLFPRPYSLAVGVAIAAPIIVLFVTYLRRERLRLWQTPNEFRASTGQLIVLCVGATSLRAISDWNILDWLELVVAALVAGMLIAVAVLTFFGQRFSNRDQIIGAGLAGIAYAYGAIVPVNMWLDRSEPQMLRATVLRLDKERVVIGAPPPFQERLDVEISRQLSERLVVNGELCIALYNGAFHVRSYDLQACND